MDTLIICFSGQGQGYGNLPRYEFVNFLNKYYPHVTKQYYLDKTCKWYHSGINQETQNIIESIDFLKNQIKNYTKHKVIFIGSSSGGYAAILFGSLLNVDTVIAFRPQTIINEAYEYNDLKKIINSTTQYYIYGDPNCNEYYHNISHCENINKLNRNNVYLTKIPDLDLRTLRNNGELLQLFKSIIK